MCEGLAISVIWQNSQFDTQKEKQNLCLHKWGNQ